VLLPGARVGACVAGLPRVTAWQRGTGLVAAARSARAAGTAPLTLGMTLS
jgi:hypothetical protein